MKYRKYDTEIFYRRDTGEILYIYPEVSGFIREQTRHTKETISELKSISVDNVDIKTIKHGKLLDKIGSRQILCVNENIDDLVLSEDGGYYVINYNSQIEKHEHSYEDIMNYYNEHYIYNLRNVLEVEDIWFEWISIDDMEIREGALEFSWFNHFDDEFVAESFSDRGMIVADIVENGTYWPLVLQKVEDSYIVFEGTHRIISAKILQQSGGWDERKMLSITMNCNVHNMQSSTEGTKMLPRKMRARSPYICKFHDVGYINNDNREQIERIMAERNMVFVDDKKEIIEYDIFTYSELLQSTQSFPHWLRDLFYLHREAGYPIKGHEIINSEEKFSEWESKNV